jgi:hypothetical protein
LVPQDLAHPEQLYRKLGAKLVVGMPFKDLATSDTLLLREVPPASDAAGRLALKRLQVCRPRQTDRQADQAGRKMRGHERQEDRQTDRLCKPTGAVNCRQSAGTGLPRMDG